MKTIAAKEAKNQLGAAIDAAQREAVVITKHGRPAAGHGQAPAVDLHPKEAESRPSLPREPDPGRVERIMRWYGCLHGTFGSGKEIDAYIREERGSWPR